MYSVTFSTSYGSSIERNTYDDWHMIPTSRPTISPAQPKTEFTASPMSDGSFDLTQNITGDIFYSYREGTFEFLVENGYRPWFELYSEIMDYLHGQSGEMWLSTSTTQIYEGRFFVEQWRSDEHWSYVTIRYKIKP